MGILECLLNLICNLFTPEWITALATAAGAGAVIWGIIIGNNRFNPSLEARQRTRRAQVAEDLIITAHKIHYAMGDIRKTFYTIPKEKENDKSYRYKQYYATIDKYSELFNSLHEAEIYARVVLGYDNIKEAVEILFSARNEVLNAIGNLSLYENIENPSKEERDEMIQLRQIAFNTNSKDNVLTKQINDAVKTIETRLSHIVRIEEKKSKRTKK